MEVMCQQCGFNIHIDDTQVPPYSFQIECPRCRKSVTASPPPKPEPTLPPDSAVARAKLSVAASPSGQPGPEMMQNFMQMMAAMMAGSSGSPKVAEAILQKGFAWQRKHVLICCAEPTQRQNIEKVLDNSSYDNIVAQNSTQAIETMQDVKIDIIILDPQFDASRQGGIAVLRHVSSLMPKYRRRIYVVLVSPQVKTLDTYMAFLNCVNLTVNTDDLEAMPAILEKSIRDFNELYRPIYEASSIQPF